MWWGSTPALDIGNEIEQSETNVLLISQSDCRHVLQSVAKKYRHPKNKQLNLYIFEPRLENIGRSLLFLTLAFDKQVAIGRKTLLFTDLYGNALLRPSTWQYLNEGANRLIKAITNFTYAERIMPCVALDGLKYKERDQLEHIFKFWSGNGADFNILKYWDDRQRALLGTRYDSRTGVVDWDLHMRYRPYGADILAIHEYKQFREKGVAFLQDDTDPCVPNLTFANFAAGARAPAYGYYADIVTGPYPAFGLNSEEKELFSKCNGMYKKCATDVTFYNVQQMFHELEHQTPYVHPKTDFEGTLIRQDLSEQFQLRPNEWRSPVDSDPYSPLLCPDVKIYFMSLNALKDYTKKPQFHNFFDLITIPQHLVTKYSSEWGTLCAKNCKIIVESSKYVLNYNKETLAKLKTELDEYLQSIGVESTASFDYKKDDFIRYKLVKA